MGALTRLAAAPAAPLPEEMLQNGFMCSGPDAHEASAASTTVTLCTSAWPAQGRPIDGCERTSTKACGQCRGWHSHVHTLDVDLGPKGRPQLSCKATTPSAWSLPLQLSSFFWHLSCSMTALLRCAGTPARY